jgi:signal peptidase I
METNKGGQMDDMAAIKHSWKAVFLTGLFTGAGHLYAGARLRGIFLIAFAIILSLTAFGGMAGFLALDAQAAARASMIVSLGSLLLISVIHIAALFDAHKAARKFNSDHGLIVDTTGRKKAWLAMFLSLFLFPGIGQFYNGQVVKGIGFVVALLCVFAGEDIFYQFSLLVLALYFFSIKDAFDSAEKRNGSSERFSNQGNGLLVFIMVMLFFKTMPYGPVIKENFLKAYKIPAGSMVPTLQIGDHLLIDKRQKAVDGLQRGDIVVFPYPENPAKNFIKRAMAFGGDKVQFINGDLYINDDIVPKKLIQTLPGNLPGRTSNIMVYEEQLGDKAHRIQYLRDDLATFNQGPWIVPDNEVFVLGDNRDNSQDSRVWGAAPRNTIEGKALKLYWSWDGVDGRVNWERIGQSIL